MSFDVGDHVKYVASKRNRKLLRGMTYRVESIRRCLDGAYDWDDLYLEGVAGKFCEFEFKKVNL
jgi:hypothetical protein